MSDQTLYPDDRNPGDPDRINWHWRTEPEIGPQRQAYLAERRAIPADRTSGVYPFHGVQPKLSRADIEWLLATHESGGMRGPVDWSDEKQRQRPGLDLRGADLRDLDLTRLPLAGTIGGMDSSWWQSASRELQDASIIHVEGANLSAAHLEGANLSAARLDRAFLSSVEAEQVNLTGAHLERAVMGAANLQGASLISAHLQNAILGGAHLQGAHLMFADLNGAVLGNANLEGADLSGAQMRRCILGEAQLKGANLKEARMQSANLISARLEGANLSAAQLQAANISAAHLEGAELTGAYLEQANLGSAHLEGSNFINARLQSAILGNTHLEGAHLEHAHLEYAVLGGAHLEGAHLTGAFLKGAVLGQAHLAGANLFEAHLEGAVLGAAHLQGKDMTAHPQDFERVRRWVPDFLETLPPADLRRAFFDPAANLEDVIFGEKKRGSVRLADVRWGDVNLAVVEWDDLDRLGDEIDAERSRKVVEVDTTDGTKIVTKLGARKTATERSKEYKAAARAYRFLSVALREQGLAAHATRFHYRAEVMDRKALFYRARARLLSKSFLLAPAFYLQWLLSLALGTFAGYGDQIWRLFATYAVVIAGFAGLFLGLSHISVTPSHALNIVALSVTAFHGRGISPPGLTVTPPMAWWSAVESVTGLLIEGLFIAAFTRRVTGN